MDEYPTLDSTQKIKIHNKDMYYCDKSVSRKPKGLSYVPLSQASIVLYDSNKVKKPRYKGKNVISLKSLKKFRVSKRYMEAIQIPRDFPPTGMPVRNLTQFNTELDMIPKNEMITEDSSVPESIRMAQRIALQKGFINSDNVSPLTFMDDVDQEVKDQKPKENIHDWYANWLEQLKELQTAILVIAAIPYPAKLPDAKIDEYQNPYTAYAIYQWISRFNEVMKDLKEHSEALEKAGLIDESLHIDDPDWYKKGRYQERVKDLETHERDRQEKSKAFTWLGLIGAGAAFHGVVTASTFFSGIGYLLMGAETSWRIYNWSQDVQYNLVKDKLTLRIAEVQFTYLITGSSPQGISPVWLKRLNNDQYWTNDGHYAFLNDYKRFLSQEWPRLQNRYLQNHDNWKKVSLTMAFENMFTFMCQSTLNNQYTQDSRCELHQPSIYLTGLEKLMSIMGENKQLIHIGSTNQSICQYINQMAEQYRGSISDATLLQYHDAVINTYPQSLKLLLHLINGNVSDQVDHNMINNVTQEWENKNETQKFSFILYAMIIALGGICHINHTFLEWMLHHEQVAQTNLSQEQQRDLNTFDNLLHQNMLPYDFGKAYEEQAYTILSIYRETNDPILIQKRRNAIHLSIPILESIYSFPHTGISNCTNQQEPFCGYTLSQMVQTFYMFYRLIDDKDMPRYLNEYQLDITLYMKPKEKDIDESKMTDLEKFKYKTSKAFWNSGTKAWNKLKQTSSNIWNYLRQKIGLDPTEDNIVGELQPRMWAEYFRDIMNHHGFYEKSSQGNYSRIYDIDINMTLSQAIDQTNEDFKQQVTQMIYTKHDQPIRMPQTYVSQNIQLEQFILLALAGLLALPNVEKLLQVRKDWYDKTHSIVV